MVSDLQQGQDSGKQGVTLSHPEDTRAHGGGPRDPLL